MMRPREIQDALHRLREEKFRLEAEYEENGGEVTEATMSREQAIADIKTLLMSKDGIDSLGRLIRSNTDDIQGYKDEKKHLDSQIKRIEGYNEWLLGLVNGILEESDEDVVKGNLGYSFTQHTSVTTKVDNKMIRERFHEKALAAIRSAGIPADVTISLSASISSLPEGSELPEWYSMSSVGKATFRKPRKAKEEDEFNVNDF